MLRENAFHQKLGTEIRNCLLQGSLEQIAFTTLKKKNQEDGSLPIWRKPKILKLLRMKLEAN